MARLEIIVDSGNAKKNIDDLTQSLTKNEGAGNIVNNITQKVNVTIKETAAAAKTAEIATQKLAAATSQATTAQNNAIASAQKLISVELNLEKALNQAIVAENNATASGQKLVTGQINQAAATSRLITSQQRLATEQERTAAASLAVERALSAAVRAETQAAIASQRLATEQQRTAAATASASAAQDRASASAQRLSVSLQATATANTTANSSIVSHSETTVTSLDGIGSAALRVAGIVAAAFSVSAIVSTIDGYTNLQNKLRLVTTNQYALASATKDVFDISQSTRTALDSNVLIYQRFTENATRLALSQQQVASVSKTVAQAVAISGSSTESANAAIQQFSQSLASGVFRGEEFNAVNEQAHGIITALQVGLGKTSGELRTMANNGQLTSSVLVEGLQKSKDIIDKLFGTSVPTLGQAFTVLGNESKKFLGEQTTGAAADLSRAIIFLSQNFDLVAKSVEVLAAGALAGFLTKSAVGMVSAADSALQLYTKNMLAAQSANSVAVSEARAAATALAAAKAEQVLAAESAALTGINARLAAATVAVSDATTAMAAADLRASEAKAALGIASRGVLGIIGGPVGLAVIAASVAAAFLLSGDNAKDASPKIDILGKSYEETRKSLEGLTAAERAHEEQLNRAKIGAGQQTIAQTREDISRQVTATGARGGFADTNTRIAVNQLSDAFLKGTIDGDKFQQQLSKMDGLPDGFIEKITAGVANYNSLIKVQKEQIAATELQAKANADIAKEEAGLSEKQLQALRDKKALIEQQKTGNALLIKQARDLAQQAKDVADPTEEGKARRAIELSKLSIEQGGQNLKYTKEQEAATIAAARAVDVAQKAIKDKADQQAIDNKLAQESVQELNRQKTAYDNLLNSQLDPIEAINKKYREQIDLIDKAMAGRFKATGAAAITNTKMDYQVKDKPLSLNFADKTPEEIRAFINSAVEIPKSVRDGALADFEKFLATRNELFRKASSDGINISRAEGDARVALVKMQQAADINMYNAQYTQQLASLSDYAKSAQDILDEKLAADKLKNENSYITDVNGAQKRADMLLAIEKKFAHDSAEILIQRTQERTAILQGLQDKRDTTAFGEQNAVTGALGGSTQAGINQNVFAIQQKVQQDVAAEQDKMREDMAAADRKAANDKIALIQQVGDAEIADAQRTSAAVLDTRSALLAAGTAIEDGIAQSLTKAIIQGDNLRETLRGVAISGAEMLLQSMIKIGLQHGVNALLEVGARQLVTTANVAATAIEKATTVGAVAAVTPVVVESQTAIATAAAPAAAGVSIATLGTGAIIALGAVAAVYALTKGFSGGGYTGDGGVNDPAGIVHKGEVVWSQDDIRRAGGVDAVESMRRGMQTSYMQDVAPQRMQSSNQSPQTQNPVINIHNHGIDEAIEDWFKGSSSDKHFVNKFERNKSSMRMA